MPRRDIDRDRLIEIDAVLEHLRQVKDQTIRVIETLQRTRDRKHASMPATRRVSGRWLKGA